MRYRFLRYPEGKFKAITLSYDDGCRSDLRFAEMLDKYGMKATFNLCSDWLEGESAASRLTKQQIEENFLAKGHEIAVHGANHVAPGRATPVNCISDVLRGRQGLEKIFGRIIRGMAYPDSGIRKYEPSAASVDEIKQTLKAIGIVYSRTLGGDNDRFELPYDWYEWMPTAHHNNPKLMEYLDEFLNIDYENAYISTIAPRLFYLWGHTYEFDNNNNWDMIENFCEKASNKDDVWYATNIEIYDYVQAYEKLIFNVDNTLVYNPTLVTVWFVQDGELFCVRSGETKILK